LQVNDYERSLRSQEAIVTVELAALRFDLGDDGLRYGHFVHGFLLVDAAIAKLIHSIGATPTLRLACLA
jgi:hypothetical protein